MKEEGRGWAKSQERSKMMSGVIVVLDFLTDGCENMKIKDERERQLNQASHNSIHIS